jgi:hypothetical protein
MMTIIWNSIVGLVSLALFWTLAETLLWWYLWHKSVNSIAASPKSWQNAVIFLTGISNYAIVDLAAEQKDFLQELGKQINVDIIVERFYHLTGSNDNWAKLGKLMFPGRWFPVGALRRSIADNRFLIQSTGNHQHLEYLSDRLSIISDTTYRSLTLSIITQLSIWQEKGIKI